MMRFPLLDRRRAVFALAGMMAAVSIATAVYSRASADAPNVLVLQRAYDREAISGNAAHDTNLLVIDALCYRRQQHGLFYCIVQFTDRRDTDRRLYYDIAEISAERGEWRLKSGLCKR